MNNMVKAFLFQCKHHGFIKAFFIDKNGRGIFSKNSHYSKGKEKVKYNSLESAIKASKAINKKYGSNTEAYKCGFCDAYHIGNNKV